MVGVDAPLCDWISALIDAIWSWSSCRMHPSRAASVSISLSILRNEYVVVATNSSELRKKLKAWNMVGIYKFSSWDTHPTQSAPRRGGILSGAQSSVVGDKSTPSQRSHNPAMQPALKMPTSPSPSTRTTRGIWGSWYYQFTCLSFGLSCAPWTFTKVVKPLTTLLSHGVSE